MLNLSNGEPFLMTDLEATWEGNTELSVEMGNETRGDKELVRVKTLHTGWRTMWYTKQMPRPASNSMLRFRVIVFQALTCQRRR